MLKEKTKSSGRPKTGNTFKGWRVRKGTGEALSQIAFNFGFRYSDRGSVGKLLDAIADGSFILVPVSRNLIKK